MSYEMLSTRTGVSAAVTNANELKLNQRREIDKQSQEISSRDGSSTNNDNAIETVIEDSSQNVNNKTMNESCNSSSIINNQNNTPVRKISSRSLNPFTNMVQLYTNDEIEHCQQTDKPIGISSFRCNHRNLARPHEETFPEIKGRVESKLMSMWHNVKYGWSSKMRSHFSKEQPVWLLGRCYHRKCSPISSMESSAEFTSMLENKGYINEQQQQQHEQELQQQQQQQRELNELMYPTIQEFGMDAVEEENADNSWEEGIEGFKKDFYSRMWMTYRREFPIMNGSNYTSDCGWGCMLRSGQMLLAQAMICHFLGRGWRYDQETQIHSTHEDNMHRKIIRWFGDSSSKSSPFSIHTLVTLGQETGKKPGDWYGPSSVSYLLRQAVKLASQENADFDDLIVYVAQDCTVYMQDIFDECWVPDPHTVPLAPWQQRKKSVEKYKHENNMHWKSLVLLVPLRLGTEKLNQIYGNSLKTLLSTEHCIGIIGGRPKHSLYFVGYQEDKLIHLDPHYCQEMVDVNHENFPVHSFHCKSPRKLKLSKLDPCCCIGFYCQTKSDFDNFVAGVQPYLMPTKAQTGSPSSSSSIDINYPMFVFSRSRHSDHQADDMPESLYKKLQQQLREMRQHHAENGINQNNSTFEDDDDDETDEFVII